MLQKYTELLISEVYRRRSLWDINQKTYHNRYVSDKEWEEVAYAVGSTKIEAKNKWKSLRDAFRRELRKRPDVLSGHAAPCKRNTWCYFESLMFLRDVMAPRESDSNMESDVSLPGKTEVSSALTDDDDEEDETEAPEVFVETLFGDHTSSEGASVSSEEFVPAASTHPIPKLSSKKRKRREDTSIEKFLKLEHEKVKIFQKEECGDTRFLLSLVPHMRKLDDLDKLDAMSQIIDILKNKINNKK